MVALRPSFTAAVAFRSVAAAAGAAMQMSELSSTLPPLRDSLSGIFGSVSLTAWICLLLPQLIQNYKAQSAEGLSMAFLFVWLLGDITNLFGALWTGLAPTAVALATYFCFADLVLIGQCVYYNTLNARRASQHAHVHRRRRSSATAGPLLSRRRSSSIGLPGSHRRHSARRSESNLDPLRCIITGEDETPDTNPWVHNALSLVAVFAVGTVGYFASYRMGAWDTDPEDDGLSSSDPENVYARIGMVLGYFSAVCYLCARIPQIFKNYREKSCEGLALLFFLLSLTGNLTYGASLVSYSQDRDYLIKALPWLLGSLGTVVEDGIIFMQFRLYTPKRHVDKAVSNETIRSGTVGTYGAV
ncbi:vacuolar membrane pq loop repeat protein [Grosmannia clavigera kw1407]|uniref:Vacuolar membrane pq loop repeat protein n=1 Tax=Grosmannia clavigera (strain kw1407 / UAMH 11150) TaxID=655863 RepID=F0XJ36_GROCL|nr:vacuolar membrane pq loop repeat protein [Grosmannia clavigera kw1407]EFX02274.1 vacuolar membrane pq loop repeat protein [Grosmannia clavigera kw1407]